MASVSLASCYFASLIISLSFLGTCLQVRGEEITHHMVDVNSLMPNDVCSPYKDQYPAISNHARLRVVHQYGPCSPLGRQEAKPSLKQILEQDQARVDSMHCRAHSKPGQQLNTLAETRIPAHIGISFGIANYVVTVGFGTPETDQTVSFDTGSDVSWIQCEPCLIRCYRQQQQIFKPSQSSTYRTISCSSSYCSQLRLSGCNNSSTCLYGVGYGDGSYTIGFYAEDTLTLTPSNVIPSFRFGCGQNNSDGFGQIAGLLGLGADKPSLISQTFQRYGGVFAYCLPPNPSTTGYLTLGGSYPSNLQFTPMLSNPNRPTFYYLSLTGISVGGQQLSIPPTVFSNAGTIIDSGTVITRLPPTAYSALRSAFRQGMTAYKTAPASGILDTCYDFSGLSNVTIPAVALHFGGGATINLDPEGIVFFSCLAFAANGDDSDMSTLGNVQQRRFNVVYDLSKRVIRFGPGAC